ncbi:MAG: alpha-amylase family protein [Dehalococcoidia bacterium]
MPGETLHDLWWKNAVIYCLDVETFLDGNGDGIGDFKGLSERVDYLAGIGVTCIWLMPFFPSVNRDDGYDICDYYTVDPRLGDMGDFVDFIHTADAHGIRVIADLVMNHTSDQHPWFQSARSDPKSPYRRFYVWRDEPPDEKPSLVFPGEQISNWTYDEVAKQYYFHHFYRHQPDLNPDEPAVREEMTQIMGFWLQQGLAGFRVDAVPFLIELENENAAEELTPHGFLKDLRRFLGRRRGDAVMLGEVNLPPHEQVTYFGEDDELSLVFNFYVNQHLYLSLVREDPDPLRKALEALPPIPGACQWANFVRNHDEQNLDKLTPSERQEVFDAFAPQKSMQSFGRGIRRRQPPMLGGDQRKLKLTYSLLFSLPGTPVLFYGEEIGMGDNPRLPGRLAVRSPMQWKPRPNGGFSTARPKDLLRGLPAGEFGPAQVNVQAQRDDPLSMLNWTESLIRRRKEAGEFGFGKYRLVDGGKARVLAHACEWETRTVIALHNFSGRPEVVDLSAEIDDDVIEVNDMWADQRYPAVTKTARIGPYGYRWLRVIKKGQELLL